MSDGLNRVILLGNLGADPELRYTTAGTAVLSLRLATSESFVDRNKEAKERTEWHQIVVWGAKAEALSKILVKGSCVMVEGAIRTSSYEKEGGKRYRTEIHARDVYLTGRRGAGPSKEGAPAVPAGRDPRGSMARGGKKQEALDELPY